MTKWTNTISLLMLLSLCACKTDVELCDEPEHPHRARLVYNFNWDDNKDYTPDSMTVLANRVINMWKSAMSVNSTNGGGTYIFNAPMDYRPGTENNEKRISETVTWQTGLYKVPIGEYKFIAFNMEAKEFDYSHVYEFFSNPEMPQSELNILYHTYKQGDSGLRFIIPSWIDYNPYANYIQPSTHALFYDTLSTRVLNNKDIHEISFSPKELTQQVDIYFSIAKINDKQPFTVDSVFAEVSGLPNGINLETGFLNVERTNKMMFRCDKISDTETNKKVACHGQVHVPGIMRSRLSDVFIGPGIMQVMIYCSAYSPENNKREVKKFQGKINLYNTLTRTPSIKMANDRLHAQPTGPKLKLQIQARMEVDGEKILEASDESSGMDIWKNAKEVPSIIDL